MRDMANQAFLIDVVTTVVVLQFRLWLYNDYFFILEMGHRGACEPCLNFIM